MADFVYGVCSLIDYKIETSWDIFTLLLPNDIIALVFIYA